MSCVLRRNLQGEEESPRTDPLLVFAAVKKTAPSSREAFGPEVPDESFFVSSPRGAIFRKLLMHAVPRMRLRSATFVLSVGLLFFFQRGVGFSPAISLSTPGEKFEF